MSFTDFKAVFLMIVIFWVTPRRFQLVFLSLAGISYLIIIQQLYTLLLVTGLTLSCYFCANQKSKIFAIPFAILAVAVIFSSYKLFQNYEKNLGHSFVLLGFSFFFLRLTHYLSEAYKGSLPIHTLQQFLSYIFFPPTLIIGPVNRFQDFLRDEYRRRWDSKLFIFGMERVLFGYFKIIVLANYLVTTKLGILAEIQGGDSTPLGAYLLSLEYGLGLYFRFGGYSDIAIGIGAMMGFRIIENFNFPFLSSNINQFWQRWHISLSSWCRDYIFSPIAFKLRNPAIGVIASMLILGLWHEVSFRYLVWGTYHGLGIIIWRYWQNLKLLIPAIFIPARVISLPISIIITFNFVVLSFVITRLESLDTAIQTYIIIFKGLLCLLGC